MESTFDCTCGQVVRFVRGCKIAKCGKCGTTFDLTPAGGVTPIQVPQADPPESNRPKRKTSSLGFVLPSEARIIAWAMVIVGASIVWLQYELIKERRLPNLNDDAGWVRYHSEVERRNLYMFFAGGVAVAGVIALSTWVPSQELKTKAVSLGEMIGMKKKAVLRRMGRATMVEHTDAGELLTWTTSNYSITLFFVAGECRGVVREVDTSTD